MDMMSDPEPMATNTPATNILGEIFAERERQVLVHNYTPDHDDSHDDGQLCQVAMAYCQSASTCVLDTSSLPEPRYWPWDGTFWNPKNPRRDLIRAAALIVAEIERIDRAK